MAKEYWFFMIGFALGWVTKIPFLIKWYKDLKKTRNYERAKDGVHYHEMVNKYNELFPDKKIIP